ncbi:MAG: protein phosphatase 2C domain-containing protein [Alphaproteobacteria bacterium]|nr:protein phosphatase 2C domain-containing protein [Alphaproteobacteria bacterium]
MSRKKQIKVLEVSVCGPLHKSKGLPCQDCYCHKIKGKKLVAIVSDGAGSAKYGKIGAKIVCETLCDVLLKSNLKNIQDNVKKAINTAREKLIYHRYNKSKSVDELVNFSATVVGAFYHHGKGVLFHIGDGAGIVFTASNYDNLIISEPENGAYSCETFFYTMSDWEDCLRFTPFENINRLILMTDGVTGFVFGEDFSIRQNFLIPIVEYLENEEDSKRALKALQNTLNDRKAQRINPDDKTMLWVRLP